MHYGDAQHPAASSHRANRRPHARKQGTGRSETFPDCIDSTSFFFFIWSPGLKDTIRVLWGLRGLAAPPDVLLNLPRGGARCSTSCLLPCPEGLQPCWLPRFDPRISMWTSRLRITSYAKKMIFSTSDCLGVFWLSACCSTSFKWCCYSYGYHVLLCLAVWGEIILKPPRSLLSSLQKCA